MFRSRHRAALQIQGAFEAMTASRVEPGFDQDRNFTDRDAAHGLAADPSRVLIAGNSQINRIVVAKIVERSGLRPVSESPVSAVRVLPLLFPGLVILDGGPDNKDCDSVIAGVVALRRASGKGLPAVILLSNRTADPASFSGIVDAVVTKPFTTDQLQPVVDRLVGKAKG
jgi:CheY-like chemotaxis protein